MSISRVTRRNIKDAFENNNISWAGRLEETEFLSKIYDLSTLPSENGRFEDVVGDIWQHRINNEDWDYYWVFNDERFQLSEGPDDIFLRFCCQMVHPLVRPNRDDVTRIVAMINEQLRNDGWELVEATRISGLPVFTARQLIEGVEYHIEIAEKIAERLDATYISQQIIRIRSSTVDDPELAIGTAKEFVETVCKSILRERNISIEKSDDFTKLVRKTLKELKLVPDDISNQAKAADTIRVLLSNLGNLSKGLSELRNPYGSGHGRDPKQGGLLPRHARLAVGSAITLATFLFETHSER